MSEACRIIRVGPSQFRFNRLNSIHHPSHGDPLVGYNALYALSTIAYWADGATAVVEAGVLQLVDELVESRTPSVPQLTAVMLLHVVNHPSMVVAVLGVNACRALVTLIR